MRILNKQTKRNFSLSFLTLSLFSSLTFSTSISAKIDFIDRIELPNLYYSGHMINDISADGKITVTGQHLISSIHFNNPSNILKTEGNITYRQFSEEDIWIIKELLPNIPNTDTGTNFSTKISSLSPDGTILGENGYIWHKNGEKDWKKETIEGKPFTFNSVGNIAGGQGNNGLPTVWIKNSQNSWQAKHLSDNSGTIENLNQSGTIAVGSESRKISKHQDNDYSTFDFPVLWTGTNWNKSINLAELIEINDSLPYANSAYAINAKGDIVGGSFNGHPIIWSGENWKEITWLGEEGGVLALNAKGDIAIGELNSRPVIWSGEKWNIVTPLILEDVFSEVYSISEDGSVISGRIEHSPALWRITYSEVPDNAPTASLKEGEIQPEQPITGPVGPSKPDPDTPNKPVSPPTPDKPNKPIAPTEETAKPTTPEISKPAEKPPVVTAMIDVPNTERSIIQMGHDTFELFSLQFGALRRLQEECVAGKGEICYALQHNYAAQNGNYDNALNLRVGYGFTDNLTFGVNFDRSLRRSLPDTYRRLSGNGGVGVFGHYQLPYHAYISAGIGWDYYRVQAQRPLLANTEFAPTKSRVRGLAWNVTVGQDFTLSNDSQLGWYLAYRQTEIKRDGYRENVPGFPVEYGAANLKDNAIAIGAKFALPITPKLSWISAVEFERRLGGESPVYSAKAQYVSDVRYQPDLNHSRWNAQSGLRYAFAPNLSLSLTPFWGNSIVGNNQWGTKLTLEGRF